MLQREQLEGLKRYRIDYDRLQITDSQNGSRGGQGEVVHGLLAPFRQGDPPKKRRKFGLADGDEGLVRSVS